MSVNATMAAIVATFSALGSGDDPNFPRLRQVSEFGGDLTPEGLNRYSANAPAFLLAEVLTVPDEDEGDLVTFVAFVATRDLPNATRHFQSRAIGQAITRTLQNPAHYFWPTTEDGERVPNALQAPAGIANRNFFRKEFDVQGWAIRAIEWVQRVDNSKPNPAEYGILERVDIVTKSVEEPGHDRTDDQEDAHDIVTE